MRTTLSAQSRRLCDGRAGAEAGHEAVGQALLITAVGAGALTAVGLSHILIDACTTMIQALS